MFKTLSLLDKFARFFFGGGGGEGGSGELSSADFFFNFTVFEKIVQ